MIAKRLLISAVVTIAAVVVSAQPASASPSILNLTVAPAQGAARTVTLQCSPEGGSHPNPVKACKDLAQANGDPAAIKPTNAPCPAVVQPVTATAVGHWIGRRVDYKATYENRCHLVNATADVFRF